MPADSSIREEGAKKKAALKAPGAFYETTIEFDSRHPVPPKLNRLERGPGSTRHGSELVAPLSSNLATSRGTPRERKKPLKTFRWTKRYMEKKTLLGRARPEEGKTKTCENVTNRRATKTRPPRASLRSWKGQITIESCLRKTTLLLMT